MTLAELTAGVRQSMFAAGFEIVAEPFLPEHMVVIRALNHQIVVLNCKTQSVWTMKEPVVDLFKFELEEAG